MVVPACDPIPKDPFVPDIKLLVIPAFHDKSLEEQKAAAKFLSVGPSCDVPGLKKQISKAFSVQVTDMTLYFRNQEGPHSQRLEILDEGYSLKLQGVSQGALIVCQLAAWDRPRSKLGESAYYMWAANQPAVPDEIRVQKCGAPVQLGVATGETQDAAKMRQRSIQNYSWVDESRRQVKIYIDAESDPLAVAAAGAGEASRVQPVFQASSLRVDIIGENATSTLAIKELEHTIIPEECKVKVSVGKRITISLRKEKEDSLWNTLIRRK